MKRLYLIDSYDRKRVIEVFVDTNGHPFSTQVVAECTDVLIAQHVAVALQAHEDARGE